MRSSVLCDRITSGGVAVLYSRPYYHYHVNNVIGTAFLILLVMTATVPVELRPFCNCIGNSNHM